MGSPLPTTHPNSVGSHLVGGGSGAYQPCQRTSEIGCIYGADPGKGGWDSYEPPTPRERYTARLLVGNPSVSVPVGDVRDYLICSHLLLIAYHYSFIIDTWQYFLHRLMHVNKFLYKQFHSWHHRLYVPYAFGSLYNHPVEGFVLDSLGAVLAEWATGMTTRQAMLLFTVSTLKTVDDHCGYSFPWDPLQILTRNNAGYHDIHHQVR